MNKLVLGMLLFLHYSVFSQNSNTIAKLKYEEAEEAFEKNNFSSVYKNLDEAEKLLGSVNPRTLYLRIVTQVKHIEADPEIAFEVIEQARANTKKYLTEYESSNEDKFREIYKCSKTLDSYPQNLTAYNERRKQQQKIKEKKAIAAGIIKGANELQEKLKWKPGLTESAFLSQNSAISGRWDRYAYETHTLVGKHVGSPLSVGGYIVEGASSYELNKENIVTQYTYCMKKAKNEAEACNKIFQNWKTEAESYGDYVKFENNSFTIAVPASEQQPNIISYYITISVSHIKSWSAVYIKFDKYK